MIRTRQLNMLGYAMGRALGLPRHEAARWAGSRAKTRKGAANAVAGMESDPKYNDAFERATMMLLRARMADHLTEENIAGKLRRHAEIAQLED